MVAANDNYKPMKEGERILKKAMAHIQSVPYKVTARWVFYRLLQDGLYKGKDDYHMRFMPLQSKVRKSFYNGWSPDVLADDTRAVIEGGDGFDDLGEWLDAIKNIEYKQAKWHEQQNYIEVWFEAAAMVAQFRHYIHDVSLFAFRGDCSIAAKWDAAKRLEGVSTRYDLPIKILYFGDDDPKGHEIPKSAMADIQAWCRVPFEFIRAGLNPGDGVNFGLPENPDKPGSYQWEALDDEQAGKLITDVLNRYYDFEALDRVRQEEDRITSEFREKIEAFIDDYQV